MKLFSLTSVIIISMLSFSSAAEIHDSVRMADLQTLKSLLKEDPGSLELKDEAGLTPVNAAAFYGDLDVFKFLVQAGADLNSGDNEGSLPLHNAAAGGSFEIVRYLVEELHTDVNILDANQVTALHFASGRGFLPIVEFLLQQGADVQLRTNAGSTPIIDSAFSRNLELTKLLVQHGSDVRDENEFGVSALHYAARNGDVEFIQYLLDNGADLYAESGAGETALAWAVIRGNYPVAEYLIQKGLDVDHKNSEGQTVLHRLWNSTPEAVTFLLEHGADPAAADTSGTTPLHIAGFRGDSDIISKLVSAGADVNAASNNGRTPLLNAVQHDSIGAVFTLLNLGAKTDPGMGQNSRSCSYSGGSPLHQAVKNSNPEIIQLLLEKGADLNVQDQDHGWTPLHTAAIHGNAEVCRLLLEQGANTNIMDQQKNTALYYAEKYQHPQVKKCLSDFGGKSKKLEKNYRKDYLHAQQKDGSAAFWYLGHNGWGIKTENHFLIVDYWEFGARPDQPALANGWVNPDELKGQDVIVFVSHDHGDHFDPAIFDWQESLPGIKYVMGFEPRDVPPYTYIAPRQSISLDGLVITAIESNDTGAGFLIELDGLVIYHSGDHANRERDFSGPYLAEIEFLQQMNKPIDIAFMPISGCGFGDQEAVKLGVYKTLDMLNPRVFCPMHAINNEIRYRDFVDQADQDGFRQQMFASEIRGDRFYYKKGKIRK